MDKTTRKKDSNVNKWKNRPASASFIQVAADRDVKRKLDADPVAVQGTKRMLFAATSPLSRDAAITSIEGVIDRQMVAGLKVR